MVDPAMQTDKTIDYVEFAASDLAEVQTFYETVFGWEFTSWGDDYSSFSDGKMNGGFYRAPLQSTASIGGALVVLYASDLEATQKRVASANGKIVKAIISFPGGRRFQFTDPAGNELGVWSDK